MTVARSELEKLYRILTDVRFEFVPPGESDLRTVYEIIKHSYPELCDDSYQCATNCKSGVNQPEWKHVVRTALNEMKKRGERITTGSSRGLWVFGGPAFVGMESSESVIEGRKLLKLHIRKERKPRIVRAKKRAVLAATGRLICEACDFDFAFVYGQVGEGFAECHHCVPLATLDGEARTRLTDLAIVCANCHRMLHRGRPMPDVTQLRQLIASRRPVQTHT